MSVKNTKTFIGELERAATMNVLDNGVLSGFSGTLTKNDYEILFTESTSPACGNYRFLGGEEVQKIERTISDITKQKFSILFNSATNALVAGLKALDLNAGSKIAVPTVSFSATVASVVAAGYTPVYVDVDSSCNMSAVSLQSALSQHDICAVIFVQWTGSSQNLFDVLEVCEKENVLLVEDASQATLTNATENVVNGTTGVFGVYSFNGPKNLSCGEGGALVTNCREIASYVRLTRNHGEAALVFKEKLDLNRFFVGFNMRPTEIQATIAHEQILRRDELNEIRINNYELIKDGLQEFLIPQCLNNNYIPYSAGFFVLDNNKKNLVTRLHNSNLPIFSNYPIEHWQLFDELDIDKYPGTKFYHDNFICFFNIGYPNTECDVKEFVNKIKICMKNKIEIEKLNVKEFFIGRF